MEGKAFSISGALRTLVVVLSVIIFNFVFLPLVLVHIRYPMLAEGVCQIIFSEINRQKQRLRLKNSKGDDEYEDLDALKPTDKRPVPCVGSVVGYREDPIVFRKCLNSYYQDFDKAMKVLMIGIDGNHSNDLEMVKIAESVFGERLAKLEIKEPFGILAARFLQTYAEAEAHAEYEESAGNMSPNLNEAKAHDRVFDFLIARASEVLQEQSLLYVQDGMLQPICLYQPHLCKKDIMFTTLIFALAIARANNIQFIWSSDSDSWIYPDTLHQAIGSIVSDESIAGSCTALSIHNHSASLVAKMVDATYSTDLALTSGMLSACDSTDCQSGPCALFRKDPLEAILVPWYFQEFLGYRPVVNEDRHLTTRLLMGGWKVTFNPYSVVATDTPSTYSAWVTQQIRWSRATAIETIAYPHIFLLHSPILAFSVARRIVVPAPTVYLVAVYLISNQASPISSGADMVYRILLCALYTSIRNRSRAGFVTRCLSQVFLQVPQSAFLIWACITAFETTWGTSMRSPAEKANERTKSPLLRNLGSAITTAGWMGLVTSCVFKSSAFALSLGNESLAAFSGFLVAFLAFLYMFHKDI